MTGRTTLLAAALLAALPLGACGGDADGDGGAGPGAGTGAGAGGAATTAGGEGTAPPTDGPPPLLPDVTAALGVDFVHVHGGRGKKFLFETMGSGVACADLDGDGRPDLLFAQSGTLPEGEFTPEERQRARHRAGAKTALYLNRPGADGAVHLEDASAGSGLDRAAYAMGLAVGDVDADGDRDVFTAHYGPDTLHLNDGAARFTDASAASGLADPRWTVGGAFLDADLDGDLDLYVVSYLDMPVSSHRVCGPSPQQRTYCHVDQWPGLDDRLWVNDGAGRFEDGSEAAGIAGTPGKGLAVVGGDYDGDGDTDLFVANDSEPNFLWRNEGGGRFEDASRMSGTDLNGEGRTEACMGTDLGDLDGDGDLDLFVVNFENETNTLYRNDGGGFFTDVSMTTGAAAPSLAMLGFGTALLDVENDGDLDIYTANGHIMDNIEEVQPGSEYAQVDQLLLNDGRGRFQLAPPELSPALAVPRVGRGVALGDLDRDGDLEVVVTNSAQAPWILRNDLAAGHRLVLRLLGPGGRADAEGARVTLRLGERTLVRELRSGGSYLSHSDSELVLGLGEAATVDELVVRWPGGAETRLEAVAADERLTLSAADGVVARETLPPLGGAGR